MDRIEAIRAYYERRMSPERESYDILDWSSAASQRMRFEILADNVPLAGRSLLDVGCGLGDLAAFLQERDLAVEYTGVDVLERMIDACRERLPARQFVHADIFTGGDVAPGLFDVVFCSGIFNLDLGNNLAFLAGAIRRLLELAREHAVFNLLHARSPFKQQGYFFYDPQEVLALIPPGACDARLIDDYLPNDFTVICRKTQGDED